MLDLVSLIVWHDRKTGEPPAGRRNLLLYMTRGLSAGTPKLKLGWYQPGEETWAGWYELGDPSALELGFEHSAIPWPDADVLAWAVAPTLDKAGATLEDFREVVELSEPDNGYRADRLRALLPE